jgi:hypothetical protein
MRPVVVTLLSVFLLHTASGQAPQAVPALPKGSAEVFAAAAPFYDFASPKLRPWHMKVSYELFDENNKSKGKGTYQYWWIAPDTYRSTWSRAGIEQTEWRLAGKRYHAGVGEPLEFFERKLESDLLTPLPEASELDPAKVGFDRKDQSFSGVTLPCVMVTLKVPGGGVAKASPMGMFPTYCFDPAHPTLRASYAYGSTSVVYNNVVRMQGMYLARQLTIIEGKHKVLTATVDTIDALAPNAPELALSKDAVAVNEAKKVTVKGDVMQAQLVRQVRPFYPPDASAKTTQGPVELKAEIGADGRVHELSVVDGPSPSLIGAAMWAVWQWEYRPYLLNGEPVAVDTTIEVNFYIGR